LTWVIGAARVTRILEQEFVMPPEKLLAVFEPTRFAEHMPWLEPDHVVGGALRMAYQSLLVESCGRRIVVDTCRGDDRPLPAGRGTVQTNYYKNLTAVVDPDAVDVVVCTHLHYDHVGWNVRRDNRGWVPTFPNAEYLFVRTEYAHWEAPHAEIPSDNPNVDLEYGVRPIVAAGLHRFVDARHAVTDEVSLVPTPGHSPGHVSVRLRSAGVEAWITGDAVHHPVQLAEPGWYSYADLDPDQAVATRAALADELVRSSALVIGTHFAAPTAGYLRRTGGRTELVGHPLREEVRT
jgi:glyoxylase-like metal-dependent hydrolase (beta-lactamase superfamily II)